MRHRVKGRKLGRTAAHRRATLRLLATSLFKHKKIRTTLAKAKELRRFAEPLITKAKNDTVAARRLVAREIKDKEVVKELFGEIAEKVRNRPGGYTRIVKLGQRAGDASEMAIIELVDYNEGEEVKKKKTKKAKVQKKAEEKVETFQESAEDTSEEKDLSEEEGLVSEEKASDDEGSETAENSSEEAEDESKSGNDTDVKAEAKPEADAGENNASGEKKEDSGNAQSETEADDTNK